MISHRLKKLDPPFATGELLNHAADVAYRRAKTKLRTRRRAGLARRPGADTPLWNLLVTEVRRAARAPGSKARLARYLGLPRQRITEYLSSRRRLPDAEITLRLLHWLEALRQGRDITV